MFTSLRDSRSSIGNSEPAVLSKVNFSFSHSWEAGSELAPIFNYLYNRKRDLTKILHKPQPG